MSEEWTAAVEELMRMGDNSPEWARAWAAIADAAGWPCYGFESWGDWALDVADSAAEPVQAEMTF